MDSEVVTKAPLLFACSGGSSVGQLANDACRALVSSNLGKMYCLAGIGGHVPGIIATAKENDNVVAVDGCAVKCALKALDAAGVQTKHHIVLTDLGIEKSASLLLEQAEINAVKEKIAEMAGLTAKQ